MMMVSHAMWSLVVPLWWGEGVFSPLGKRRGIYSIFPSLFLCHHWQPNLDLIMLVEFWWWWWWQNIFAVSLPVCRWRQILNGRRQNEKFCLLLNRKLCVVAIACLPACQRRLPQWLPIFPLPVWRNGNNKKSKRSKSNQNVVPEV